MRYSVVILLSMLLGACGNRLSNLKYAGEKVKQTINACTETTINACPGTKKSSVTVDRQKVEGDNTRAATSWDTRMMLW